MTEDQEVHKKVSAFLETLNVRRGFVLFEDQNGYVRFENHPGMKKWDEFFELVAYQTRVIMYQRDCLDLKWGAKECFKETQ